MTEKRKAKGPDDLEARVRDRTADLTRINEALQTEIKERRQLEDELYRSEERFRLLVEGVSDHAILMLDPDGTVVSWNHGAESVQGYHAEEIIGKHYDCFFCPEDVAAGKPEQELRAAAANGHSVAESWHLRKDGTRFWASSVTSALHDESGATRGFARVTRDMTGRKRAEEERERLLSAIDAQRRLFQAVLEHAPASIAIYDGEDLRIKWCNEPYRLRLEEPYRSQNITGLRLEDLLPGAEEAGVADLFRKVIRTGEPYFESEYPFNGAGRGPRYWQLSLLALPMAGQTTPDLMVLLTDITDQVVARKKIEELAGQLANERRELAAANRELDLRNREVERANRLKSEFLASMSHELRTPLHSIIGFSELISEGESGDLNAKQKRQLDHILHGARHLLSLINDILDLSKIEAGRMELHLESFVANSAIAEVLSTVEPMATARRLRVENQIDPQLVIWADRLRFKQIVYNLLSNAVKFTSSGGLVSLAGAGTEEAVEISVSDTGMGIPPEELSAIFSPFHQAGATTKGVKEGTGLGLAITRRLVEQHGGQVRVESTPGQGSRFTFHLPLRAKAAQSQVAPDTAPELESLQPHVLVVDDELSSRELLVSYLDSEGYRTATAGSGEEALEKAHALHPDAITLDVLMRNKSGWETLHQLKSDPATACIPVVIVSVLDEKQTGFALGAADYLVKPASKNTLLQSIARYVPRPRASQPVSSNTRKILVADDNPASREFLRDVLGSANYQLTEACDGGEALARITQTQPDLVLMDIQMPVMDGYAVLSEIRRDPKLAHTPVIALTAFAMRGDREKAIAAGFDGYISKPVEPASLREQVRQVLSAESKPDRAV